MAIEAVKNADAIYTDVWPETQGGPNRGRQQKIFRPYQVNRGEEIAHDVLDGRQSSVLQQAENRLHIQKGIMAYLLNTTASVAKPDISL